MFRSRQALLSKAPRNRILPGSVRSTRALQPTNTSARISRKPDGSLTVSRLWHCEKVCMWRVSISQLEMSTRESSLQFSQARWPMKNVSPPSTTCRMPLEWKHPYGIPAWGGDGNAILALTWGNDSRLSLAHSSKAYCPMTAPMAK